MATSAQRSDGIFIIVAMTLLVVGLIALGAISWFSSPHEYVIRFTDSVSGLELGAPVKARGVNVGKVSDIRLPATDIELVEVWIEVEEDVPVKRDATAMLKFQGITGLKYIEIGSGTNEAPLLPNHSEIPAERSALDRVQDRAEELADKAEKLMEALTRIDWGKSLERVDRVLEISERIMVKLEQHVDAIAGETRGLIAETRASTRTLMTSAEGTMKRVDKAMASVEDMSGGAQNLMESARSVVEEARTVVELGKGDIKISLNNFRQASSSLKELVQAIRLQPSTLLFDKPPPERKR